MKKIRVSMKSNRSLKYITLDKNFFKNFSRTINTLQLLQLLIENITKELKLL